MDIKTYFDERAAYWDEGGQPIDEVRRTIAFLSDIRPAMYDVHVKHGAVS